MGKTDLSGRCILERMSDRVHTHLSFGFVPGCPGCEQVLDDLAADPSTNDVEVLALVAV